MPKWAKILLILAGVLVLLIIGVVVATVYVWNTKGKQFLEQTMKTREDGREYGKKSDNAACVTEGLVRYKKDSSFTGIVNAKSFLTGCLQTSRPTPNFCEGVPRRLDFSDSARWRIEQCKKNDLGEDSNCQQIFDAVQEYCEEHGSSNSNDHTPPPPG